MAKMKVKDYEPPEIKFYSLEKSKDREKGIEVETGIYGFRIFALKDDLIMYDSDTKECMTVKSENIMILSDVLKGIAETYFNK